MELQNNNWYKISTDDNFSIDKMLYYNGNDEICYGFYNGCYGENYDMRGYNKEIATTVEVKEALVKEAKRRGLVGGANIITVFFNEPRICIDGYSLMNGILYDYGGRSTLFSNGKWATLVKEDSSVNENNKDKEMKRKFEIGDRVSTYDGKYGKIDDYYWDDEARIYEYEVLIDEDYVTYEQSDLSFGWDTERATYATISPAGVVTSSIPVDLRALDSMYEDALKSSSIKSSQGSSSSNKYDGVFPLKRKKGKIYCADRQYNKHLR